MEKEDFDFGDNNNVISGLTLRSRVGAKAPASPSVPKTVPKSHPLTAQPMIVMDEDDYGYFKKIESRNLTLRGTSAVKVDHEKEFNDSFNVQPNSKWSHVENIIGASVLDNSKTLPEKVFNIRDEIKSDEDMKILRDSFASIERICKKYEVSLPHVVQYLRVPVEDVTKWPENYGSYVMSAGSRHGVLPKMMLDSGSRIVHSSCNVSKLQVSYGDKSITIPSGGISAQNFSLAAEQIYVDNKVRKCRAKDKTSSGQLMNTVHGYMDSHKAINTFVSHLLPANKYLAFSALGKSLIPCKTNTSEKEPLKEVSVETKFSKRICATDLGFYFCEKYKSGKNEFDPAIPPKGVVKLLRLEGSDKHDDAIYYTEVETKTDPRSKSFHDVIKALMKSKTPPYSGFFDHVDVQKDDTRYFTCTHFPLMYSGKVTKKWILILDPNGLIDKKYERALKVYNKQMNVVSPSFPLRIDAFAGKQFVINGPKYDNDNFFLYGLNPVQTALRWHSVSSDPMFNVALKDKGSISLYEAAKSGKHLAQVIVRSLAMMQFMGMDVDHSYLTTLWMSYVINNSRCYYDLMYQFKVGRKIDKVKIDADMADAVDLG